MRRPAALLAVWTVTLTRGGDVRSDGACKDAVAFYCPGVPVGDGAVAKCLMGSFKEAGHATAKLKENGVTTACKLEVRDALIRATNRIPRTGAPSHLGDQASSRRRIGAPSHPGDKDVSRQRIGAPSHPGGKEFSRAHLGDKRPQVRGAPTMPMYKACEHDIKNLCSQLSGLAVVPCLKSHKAQLSPPCSQKLFLVQEVHAEDLGLDSPVFAACQEDLHDLSVCGRSPPSLRRKCLLSKAGDKLSEKCRANLVKMMAVDSKGGMSHPGGARPLPSHPGGARPLPQKGPPADPEIRRCMSMKMKELCNGLPREQLSQCFKRYSKSVSAECQTKAR